MTPPLQQHARRGGVYPLVLIVCAAGAAAALTGVSIRQATDNRALKTGDLTSARLLARSGIEASLQVIDENATWRTDFGVNETLSYTLAPGTVDVLITDETDGDLSTGASDPYTLTSVAVVGTAKATLRTTVSSTSGTYRDRVIAEKPVSYWPLDETSGFVADDLMGLNNAGYSNPGALGGATGYDGGPAMRMDSTFNFAWASHSPAYLLDEGTVMCWVYCNGDTTGDQMILCKSDGKAKEGDFTLALVGSSLEIVASMVSATGSTQTVSLGNLPVRTWTHLAVNFRTTVEGFVNGEMVVRNNKIDANWGTNGGDSPGNTNSLNFGVLYKGIFPSQSLNGSVRDVAIFDNDLNESAITKLVYGEGGVLTIQPEDWAWIVD